MDSHAVTSSDQLTELLGEVNDAVRSKLDTQIDDATATFIAQSPFVVVSTSDASGALDASPKGDAPGFVHVVDAHTLLIPERKGNKLAFGLRNIVDTGRIGLLFVVPGSRETVRINGTATLTTDPALLDQLSAQGQPALLCTKVAVEECFFHCGKAMIRSKLWDPTQWGPDGSLLAESIATKMGDKSIAPAIVDALEDDYTNELY